MRRLNRNEAVLLLRALGVLASIRAHLRLRGLARVRAGIARRRADRAPTLGDMREIAWSVRAAARLVPGATCLTQALAGQALLARRGLRSQVEITLPAEGADPAPHAWLLCEGRVVLGGVAAERRAHRALLVMEADGAARPAPRNAA